MVDGSELRVQMPTAGGHFGLVISHWRFRFGGLGLEVGIWGFGFRVEGLGFRFKTGRPRRNAGPGFRVFAQGQVSDWVGGCGPDMRRLLPQFFWQ